MDAVEVRPELGRDIGDRLDAYSVDALLEIVRDELASGRQLRLDCGGADHVHGAALQVLVAAARANTAAGRSFELIGLSPRLADTVRLAGLGAELGVTLALPADEPR